MLDALLQLMIAPPLKSPKDALDLLRSQGAPPRLMRHVELVSEVLEELLDTMRPLALQLKEQEARIGALLHDIGKTQHPEELKGGGQQHEAAGQALLLQLGVAPHIARYCVSHACWRPDGVTLEERLVALSDHLWKGKRDAELEQLVIKEIAERTTQAFWDVFLSHDDIFERIAENSSERLERSRTLD